MIKDNAYKIIIAMLAIVIIAQVANFYNDRKSAIDRAELHATQDAFNQAQMNNRQMLNARAKIQVAIVLTGARRNVFTPDEMAMISSNWHLAEYDYVESNPFVKE